MTLGNASAGAGNSRTITAEQAREIMNGSSDYVLLDVRSASEYEQNHIAGAKLIPVGELSARAAAELPDKNVPILVYCRSGGRAGTAVSTLTQIGYNNVFSFGGIVNWQYETVKGQEA